MEPFGVDAVRKGVAPGFLLGSVELGEGVGQAEAENAFRISGSHLEGDLTTHREADNDKLLQCQSVGELKDVLTIGCEISGVAGRGGSTEVTNLRSEKPEAWKRSGELRRPHGGVEGMTVNQDDGYSFA